MTRLHNTNCPIILQSLITDQIEFEETRFFKPRGLWYGLDEGWMDYLGGVMPDRIGKYMFELDVDMSDILIIATSQDLKNLTEKYAWAPEGTNLRLVDWARVSVDFKGVEVRNWTQRGFLRFSQEEWYHMMISCAWYWALDCNSGCVWDSSAIKSHTRRTLDIPKLEMIES